MAQIDRAKRKANPLSVVPGLLMQAEQVEANDNSGLIVASHKLKEKDQLTHKKETLIESVTMVDSPRDIFDADRKRLLHVGTKNSSNYYEDMVKEASAIKNDNMHIQKVRCSPEKQTQLDKNARYYLLDTINETKLNGVRFPIVMIDELLEEHLNRMANDPNVEFSKDFRYADSLCSL